MCSFRERRPLWLLNFLIKYQSKIGAAIGKSIEEKKLNEKE